MASVVDFSKKDLLALARTFQNNYDSYQDKKSTSGYLVAKVSLKLAFDSLEDLSATENDPVMLKLKDKKTKSFVFYQFHKWNLKLQENEKSLKNPFIENPDFQIFLEQFKDARNKLLDEFDTQPYIDSKGDYKVALQMFFKERLPDVQTWLTTENFQTTSKTYELATRWLKYSFEPEL